jgi:selenocysteine-specific elongation factor
VQTDAPRPISHHARVRVLVGTAEIMARVHCPLPIEPGGSGLARLALERPHVFRGGDRIVVRSYSPIATIGGGRVLDPLPPSRRTWATGLTDADPAVRLVSLIERRPAGVLVRSLAQLIGVAPERAVALAGAARGIRCVADRWVSATTVDSAAERALVLLGDFHASAPGSTGMPLETLRRSMDASDAVSEAALTDLQASRRIRLSGGTAALAGFKVVVQGGEDAVARIARHIHEAGLSPPTIAELAATTGYADLPVVLRVAAERGLVERVEADRYYSVQALERVSQALLEAGRTGLISPAMLRDRLGVSRKYIIPLLEWADRRGITSREAGGRRIARQSPCGTRARD